MSVNQAVAVIYTLLEQEQFANLRGAAPEVAVYGLASLNKVGWHHRFPMPSPEPVDSVDNRDLLSFRNRHINTFGFPVLILLGIGINAIPTLNFLLWGIKVWFHEFGHATIAWMSGRRAIPLPFGWTNVGEERSLFVYFGVLILLGLLFWAGRRERQRWPMILAGGLIALQFWCTWLLPEPQFETLLSFGGIGGEFYICALLIVSFYFPLPAYWRWDFYRYPVVLGAAYTFWGQFWLWRQVKRGVEDIPWGSLWGGEENGDMNNLSYAGWSDQQIINTYVTIGNLCLLALFSVYIYVLLKQNHRYLFRLSQHWLAGQP